MPGRAVKELALASAKRTLFSRPINSIKPQDKFLSSSLIPFRKVSAQQLTLERRDSLQILVLCIRSAVFPQFCQSILERQFYTIRRRRGTIMTQHVFP